MTAKSVQHKSTSMPRAWVKCGPAKCGADQPTGKLWTKSANLARSERW